MSTFVMIGAPASQGTTFTGSIALFAPVLLCFAFAWDGLVRRCLRLPAFPVAGAFGSQSALLQGLSSIILGLLAALLGGFLLLFAWGYALLASQQNCQRVNVLGCMRLLVSSVQGFAWVWLALFVLWFVLVWLRMGDPRKRVLVYGVWYRQDKVARHILQELQARQLPALSLRRLYALEEDLVTLMHAEGWLVDGKARLNDSKQPHRATSVAIMYETVLRLSAYQNLSKAEHAAIHLLLEHFTAAAQQAQRMSALRRWWVGTAQLGKGMVYGRRAM